MDDLRWKFIQWKDSVIDWFIAKWNALLALPGRIINWFLNLPYRIIDWIINKWRRFNEFDDWLTELCWIKLYEFIDFSKKTYKNFLIWLDALPDRIVIYLVEVPDRFLNWFLNLPLRFSNYCLNTWAKIVLFLMKVCFYFNDYFWIRFQRHFIKFNIDLYYYIGRKLKKQIKLFIRECIRTVRYHYRRRFLYKRLAIRGKKNFIKFAHTANFYEWCQFFWDLYIVLVKIGILYFFRPIFTFFMYGLYGNYLIIMAITMWIHDKVIEMWEKFIIACYLSWRWCKKESYNSFKWLYAPFPQPEWHRWYYLYFCYLSTTALFEYIHIEDAGPADAGWYDLKVRRDTYRDLVESLTEDEEWEFPPIYYLERKKGYTSRT